MAFARGLADILHGKKPSDKWCLLYKTSVADYDYRYHSCPTIPLHSAAFEGNTERLKQLLEDGVNVNYAASDGKKKVTALMIAASRGYLVVARLLLQNGCDVSQLDVHKRSALSYAVYEGSLSMVYYLLLYGSDANHIDNWGLSPVQCAAFTGNFYIFKLLVQFGRADRNIKSRQVGTPLEIAKMKGHKEIVDFLTDTENSRGTQNSENVTPGGLPTYTDVMRKGIRVPAIPSAPTYDAVGHYEVNLGAVGSSSQERNSSSMLVPARTSVPSYEVVVSNEENTQGAVGGYAPASSSSSMLHRPPPPSYQEVVTSNGRYDIVPPSSSSISTNVTIEINNVDRSGPTQGRIGHHNELDDFMMGFHDLMNFVRDLTAEMEADFIPTSEGLAEILVGTHLERMRKIEEKFKSLKAKGQEFANPFRNSTDDVKQKMTIVDEDEYTLMTMFTAYMFEYDVCLKHYQLCKTLDTVMDEVRELEALVISITPGDTEDVAVEQGQMIGQFNKSLEKIDKKEKRLKQELDLLDKLSTGNYRPMKVNLIVISEDRKDKFTKLSQITQNVERTYFIKYLKIEEKRKKHEPGYSISDVVTEYFFKLAENGGTEDFQMCINCGMNLRATNEDGFTALHIAAGQGHILFVQMLLDAGADVDLVTTNGTTVLYEAVKQAHIDVVRELLDRGADIKLDKNYVGRSPVILACLRRYWDILKLLIEKKAGAVNFKPSDGNPPLHYAAEEGNVDMVSYLLRKGADAELIKKNKRYPYRSNIVDLLDDSTNMQLKFLRAVRNGDLDLVVKYLMEGVNVDISNSSGLAALHFASKGYLLIVQELLYQGATIDAASKNGNTALHIACLSGQLEIVKYLVEKQASINVQSKVGFTPLYMAAQEGYSEIVRFLLANGAKGNLTTEDGFSPLAVALQQGHEGIVTLLLHNDTNDEEEETRETDTDTGIQLGAATGIVDETPWANLKERNKEEKKNDTESTYKKVHHEEMLERKHERKNRDMKASARSWVRVYAKLDGQSLWCMYPEPGTFGNWTKYCYEPQICLVNAKVKSADFYRKRNFVFYLELGNGGSFLFQASSKHNKDLWIQKLQEAIDNAR